MPAPSAIPAPPEVSGRRAAHRARTAGFSLTEVLVTLSITALASAMIVATARPSDPLKTEAEKLSHVLQQIQSQAQISGTPMGMVLEPTEYTIVAWRDGQWTNANARRHELVSGVTLRAVGLPAPSGSSKPVPQMAPEIVLDPLGHSNIAPIVLQTRGREVTVTLPSSGESR